MLFNKNNYIDYNNYSPNSFIDVDMIMFGLDASNDTFLHVAARLNTPDTMADLLELSAPQKETFLLKNSLNQTVLHKAAHNHKHPEMMTVLLKHISRTLNSTGTPKQDCIKHKSY